MPLRKHSLVASLAATACAWAAPSATQTYANPVDIDYRYGFDAEDPDKAHRSGAGQRYFVAVEAFNGNGVSPLTPIEPIR